MITNKALGKGLSALIPPREAGPESAGTVLQIPISQIKTSKYQPRLEFNQERLNDLMNSIREKGVIQPVLVRKVSDGYELIAGERRLRAIKSLGIEKVPAIVKNVADVDMLEISLIENIQREELNAMESAHAFNRFIMDFSFTQERIAKALGKDRSTVANILRLLSLPKKIQDLVSKGALTAGHAKAILSLTEENEQLRAANVMVKKGLSVRESETFVARRLLGSGQKKSDPRKGQDILDIENRLQEILGTRVKIFHGKKRGRILIEYYSLEDLNRVIDIMSKKQ